MGNTCRTCRHPKREQIEMELLQGLPLRAIAGRYGIAKASLQRHLGDGHILPALVESVRLRRLAFSEDLFEKCMELQAEALGILQEAKASKESEGLVRALGTALNAIGKTAQLLETQAKLAGQFQPDRDIEAILLLVVDVLREYPAGLVKVIQGLRQQGISLADAKVAHDQ